MAGTNTLLRLLVLVGFALLATAMLSTIDCACLHPRSSALHLTAAAHRPAQAAAGEQGVSVAAGSGAESSHRVVPLPDLDAAQTLGVLGAGALLCFYGAERQQRRGLTSRALTDRSLWQRVCSCSPASCQSRCSRHRRACPAATLVAPLSAGCAGTRKLCSSAASF